MKKKILQTLLLCFGVGAVSAQTSQISGFADLNAVALSDERTTPDKTIKNHFELGAIDMFITSQYDKVSFLGEVAFEYDKDKGDKLDFERLMINYQVKDYLRITVGKIYTPIGYWNNTYNHGILIQPTANRPEVLRDFIKNIKLKKQIGVQFSGNAITKYNFGYYLAITHGISANYADDYDEAKAVTLNLYSEPIENFRIFVSGTRDVVPKGKKGAYDFVVAKKPVNVNVMNFGVAYMNGERPYEFIGEYFNVANTIVDSVSTQNTQGYVLYAGYRIKKFVPYVSYDVLHFQDGEKYFKKNSVDAFTAGIRYMINPLSVIKMEYKYRDFEKTGVEHLAQLQFAIGF